MLQSMLSCMSWQMDHHRRRRSGYATECVSIFPPVLSIVPAVSYPHPSLSFTCVETHVGGGSIVCG
jgi:hypothetical protein